MVKRPVIDIRETMRLPEDGTLAWLDAVVVEVAEEADSEIKIRKLARKRKE